MSKKDIPVEQVEEKQKLGEKTKKRVGGFFSDFKKFISKGNIVDLAVAVVIGGAFGKIVTSLVNDIIMPLIGALFGKKTLGELVWTIKPATDTTAALTMNYGNFLQSIIDFLIIAFCIFIVLRLLMNAQKGLQGLTRKQKKELKKTGEIENLPPAPPIESQEDILKDIRELLKEQKKTKKIENKTEQTKEE